jgi:hypothetical protein
LISPVRRLVLAGCVVATVGLVSASSMADLTKDQCVDANAKAQDLRREGRLSAAREQLRQCASASCPAMVRDDCTKRLDDLENAQPTIAFEVKDASGSDVTTVKVTVDGLPLAEILDGTPLAVDRGSHVFTFTVAGRPPITRTFVLTEGEKGRREKIALDAASPSAVDASGTRASPSGSAAVEPGSSAGRGMGTGRILGLVAGGVGVAGIAVGSVFGVMTISEKNQQTTDCPSSSCGTRGRALAQSDHSTALTDSTLSTVGFIAGGALLVGGAVLFFASGHPSSEGPPPSAILLVPGVGPGGGGVWLKGEF